MPSGGIGPEPVENGRGHHDVGRRPDLPGRFRVLTGRRRYDRAASALADRFARLTAGTPQMDRDLGSVINATQKRRIEGFCVRAGAGGVPVLAEDEIASGVSAGGFLVAPRVHGAVPRSIELATEGCSARRSP